MKSAVLICALSILGACFAVESDAIIKARKRAETTSTNFNTAVSGLTSGHSYTAFLTKIAEIQNNFVTKTDAANEQIRVPADEFLNNIAMEVGTGLDSECYYIAAMRIKVDVTHYVDYSYHIGTTYSQTMNEMLTVYNDLLSEKSNDLLTIFNTAINLPNLSAEVLNALTDEFLNQVSIFLKQFMGMSLTFDAELDKVSTKFEGEISQRVTDALKNLQTIKENYATCKANIG